MMLKEKLELLIERLSDRDAAQRDFALTEITKEVQGATSTITSIPKPLKFMSVHYLKLVALFETQTDNTFKVSAKFGSNFLINQIFVKGKNGRPSLDYWNGGFRR